MTTEIHALAGAYALDAVNDVERMEFSRHLADCETCGLEVAELRATATRLADTTWAAAPPRLRDNVLRQASRTRQARPSRPGGRVSPVETPRPNRWRRWIAGGIAAGVLAAGAAAATFVAQEQRIGDERRAAQQLVDQMTRIQAVMAASDARARQVRVAGGGQLAVVYSPGLDAAVVMCADLARPARNRAYQLWFLHGTDATSAGVLPAGENAGTMLVTGVREADALAISEEPAGGSTGPDSQVARVPLS